MYENDYIIREMTRQEVDIAMDWATAEGWNPGLYDADCFYAADPHGFFIGLLDNEPVATISAVKYGDSFGFIGFFIVKPTYRGKGYGIQIGNTAITYLRGRIIGIDGVVAQQGNYQKAGFASAYRNIRYCGTGGGNLPEGPDIVPLSAIPFDEICAYDKPFFPDNRTQFLKCWIHQPCSTALGVMGKDGKVAGYGVIRMCRSGYRIGPLFSDSPQLAERLFLSLKAHAPEGASIFIDIPEVNSAALELVNRCHMTSVFETARMYAGKCPDVTLNRLFGVTTFELG